MFLDALTRYVSRPTWYVVPCHAWLNHIGIPTLSLSSGPLRCRLRLGSMIIVSWCTGAVSCVNDTEANAPMERERVPRTGFWPWASAAGAVGAVSCAGNMERERVPKSADLQLASAAGAVGAVSCARNGRSTCACTALITPTTPETAVSCKPGAGRRGIGAAPGIEPFDAWRAGL